MISDNIFCLDNQMLVTFLQNPLNVQIREKLLSSVINYSVIVKMSNIRLLTQNVVFYFNRSHHLLLFLTFGFAFV